MSFPNNMGNYLCFLGRLVLGNGLGVCDTQPITQSFHDGFKSGQTRYSFF